MNIYKSIYILILGLIIGGCNTKNHLEIGSGKDVVVTLEVTNKKDIEKIEFQANANTETVTSRDLDNYNVIKYGFNGSGEGTYRVCVFTKSDTICTADYVEGGYRPKLKCDSKRIEFEDHSGY